MSEKMFVQMALRQTWTLNAIPGSIPDFPADSKTSFTSLMIHDIFGGEILKTRKKDGWHFYNMIDGERIDFIGPEFTKSSEDSQFEDLPSTPEETQIYFDKEDYSTLFIRFIRAYEEVVGLT